MAEAQSKITGGKITFGLTVCPKQYESKRIDVEIAFTVKEDDNYEAIFDKACVVAVDRAREMVGLPKIDRPAPSAKAEPLTSTKPEFMDPPAGYKRTDNGGLFGP